MSRHTSPPSSGDGIVAQISAPKVAGLPLPNVRFGSIADFAEPPVAGRQFTELRYG
jgi:hypothetical protein